MLVQVPERNYAEEEPSTSTWVRQNFVVGEAIGHGTFGKVYTVEARRKPGQLYAMKELMRFSHPKYIQMELKVLLELGGSCNIMTMHAAHRERDRVFVIMDLFPHDSLRDIIDNITTEEILEYMKNLFIALQYLHKHGIIHRDIKPANFLYNRKSKKYSLIDFGLSQIAEGLTSKENIQITPPPRRGRSAVKRLSLSNEQDSPADKRWRGRCECSGKAAVCTVCIGKPNKNVNKAGTPGFRAPEILLRLDKQTALMDIWSAGVTMLSLLCRRHPLFRPCDDGEALFQIAVLLGSQPLMDLAFDEGHSLDLNPTCPGVDLVKLTRVAREGMECLQGLTSSCLFCSRLVYGNQKAVCICRQSGGDASHSMSDSERIAFEVLSRALIVNARSRYTADMLVSLLT